MIEIIDKREKQLTDYEKQYFLFSEAPDTPRRNVKTIKLKVSDKRHYDFRKGAAGDEEPAPEPADDTTEEQPVDDQTTDDVPADDTGEDTETDAAPEEDQDGGGDDDIVTDDDPDMTEDNIDDDDMGDEDTGDDDPGEDAPTDDDGGDDAGDDTGEDDTGDDDGGDGDIVTDDEEDINEDNMGDSGDDQDDGQEGDDNGDNDQDNDQGADDQNDSNDSEDRIHKQNLYKKFMNLHTAVNGYTHKLSSMIGVDEETNEMYTSISKRLQDLQDMLYDYMVLKFKKNSYLESMLFYQRSIAAVNMCLDALASLTEVIHADDKKNGKKPDEKPADIKK